MQAPEGYPPPLFHHLRATPKPGAKQVQISTVTEAPGPEETLQPRRQETGGKLRPPSLWLKEQTLILFPKPWFTYLYNKLLRRHGELAVMFLAVLRVCPKLQQGEAHPTPTTVSTAQLVCVCVCDT